MSVSGRRVVLLAISIFLIAALISYTFPPRTFATGPVQITSRALTLEPGATDGGSKPSGVVKHLFTFTLPTLAATTIHSIEFEYCNTADVDVSGGTCVMPNGLVTTTATLGSVTPAAIDSIHATTNGAPYVGSTAGISIGSSSVAVSVLLLTVTNPSGVNCNNTGNVIAIDNCTFFVRILAFTSTDTSGTAVEAGTVAASTNAQIQLTGTMPESLIFCTGGSVGVNGGGIPDCSTATSGSITFNQLFSPTDTAYATSQMAASTNALSGYVITVAGPTLTNGSYTIPAIGSTAALSTPGTGQFGLNLAQDTAAPTTGGNALNPVSANVTPAPNGTNYMGKAALTPTYSTSFGTGGNAAAALYAFNASGTNTVAASDNGTGTGAPTDAQIFTTTYMVNVAGSQVAGTYQTTLTYICTPTF